MPVLWMLVIGVVATLLLVIVTGMRARESARPEPPLARIADAADGSEVRIRGAVRARRETLRAPLTGRECVHYRVVLEDGVPARRRTRYRDVGNDARSVDFDVEDESGRALVRVEGALVGTAMDHDARPEAGEEPTPALRKLLRKHGVTVAPALGGAAAYRCEEGVLCDGDVVEVIGTVRREQASGEARGYRGTSRELVIEADVVRTVVSEGEPADLRYH